MAAAPLSRLTLVLGGARSGKSAYAEALVGQCAPPWTYLATAQAFDDEMRVRIDEHRARRDARWQTVEAPLELVAAIATPGQPDGPLLIDCLTLWLSNTLLAGADLTAASDRLIDALASRQTVRSSRYPTRSGWGSCPTPRWGGNFAMRKAGSISASPRSPIASYCWPRGCR